jgi:proteasome lid subunit RPN8/RPN11
LHIARICLDRMMRDARLRSPIEACGLIAGSLEEDGATVREVFPLTNVDDSQAHFTLDVHEQFDAVSRMRAAGLEPLGNFHSHPDGPAWPSEEDQRLAYDKDAWYLILSLADTGPELGVFRRRDGRLVPEPFEIVDG